MSNYISNSPLISLIAFFNENLVQGKYLLKVMADEAIEYISNMKNERIENQTIYILSKDYSKVNLEIIENYQSDDFCHIIIRNAVGKTVWKVKSITSIQQLVSKISNEKKRLTVDDITKEIPIPNIEIKEDVSNSSEMENTLNKILEEEKDILNWGSPK